jgi:hypothetical protein
MNYMRYFIAKCESVVDAFIIVRISVQFGDHFCTHAQRGRFWMVKKRQLKCPYGWRRGRLVCDLRMSGINDPALRTGRSGKSQRWLARRHSQTECQARNQRLVSTTCWLMLPNGEPLSLIAASETRSPKARKGVFVSPCSITSIARRSEMQQEPSFA